MSRVKRLTHEIRQRSLRQLPRIYLIRARVGFQGIEAFASALSPHKGAPGLAGVVPILRLGEE